MAAQAAATTFNGNLKKALAGLRRINLEGLRWRVFDAKGQVLGRLASQISTVIQGKDKPTYAPNRDDGDMCIVINAKDVCVTGRKLTDKVYYWHTGQVLLFSAVSFNEFKLVAYCETTWKLITPLGFPTSWVTLKVWFFIETQNDVLFYEFKIDKCYSDQNRDGF